MALQAGNGERKGEERKRVDRMDILGRYPLLATSFGNLGVWGEENLHVYEGFREG